MEKELETIHLEMMEAEGKITEDLDQQLDLLMMEKEMEPLVQVLQLI